jgi:hypothetical protein
MRLFLHYRKSPFSEKQIIEIEKFLNEINDDDLNNLYYLSDKIYDNDILNIII